MSAAPCVQRPGDSPSLSGHSLSAAGARMAAIDVARRAAGLSIERLAASACLSERTYRRALSAAPSSIVLERLARALVAEGPAGSRHANEARLIRATYDAMLAYLCGVRGQPFADTRAGAVNGRLGDRRERELLRQAARYLANTHLGLPQAALGRALGISKVAVHLALKTVEDLRDDPAWDRLLADAEGSIGVRG